MKSGLAKWLKRVAFSLTALCFCLWLFSPYHYQGDFKYKLIKNTIEINAPVDSVFRFLGNSANATRWSVFVDHITTLNSRDVQDGRIGSIRRCYCKANEEGIQWDEIITQVMPAQKRQIACYNLINFPIKINGLGTEQLYQSLGPDKCLLTFTLFYLGGKPSFWEECKTRFAAYYASGIFKRNMRNIKRIIETGK